MNALDITILQQFFGAYFHQDWDLEAPTDEDVIHAFVSESTPVQIAAAGRSIGKLLASCHEDERLKQCLFEELHCEYLPSQSTRMWLERVRELLASGTKDEIV